MAIAVSGAAVARTMKTMPQGVMLPFFRRVVAWAVLVLELMWTPRSGPLVAWTIN